MAEMLKKPRVVVLMPAYKAGQRVVETFNKIPPGVADEVIIVDDCSPDNTYEHVRALPAMVLRNEKNLGYGGNMKQMLRLGLAAGGDIFVELHADGQYDPAVIPQVLAVLRPSDGMLLGSRLKERGQALQHGMSPLKYVVNVWLTSLANLVLGSQLTEFQSGFRVYTRPFLEVAAFEAASDDHLFSFETIEQALYHGFMVGEIPVVCRYGEGRTEMSLLKGAKYSIEMTWALVRFWLAKAGWPDHVFAKRKQ